MSLADRIRARATAIEVGAREQLPFVADVFATELRVVLGVKGTRKTPSRPGEAPHRVTGKLVGSVVVRVYEAQGVAYVGPTAEYGKYLEPLRPFYDIAAESCRQRMRDILDDI